MKIFANTSAQIVTKIITSGTGFFITLLIARSFGIAGYSDLAKITALVGLFYLMIDLGVNAVFLQFEENEQRFSSLLSFRLLFALVAFAITCILMFILPYGNSASSGYSFGVKLGITLFSFSYFSRAIVYSATAYFQKSLTYSKATIATFVGSTVTLLLILTSVFFHLQLIWVVGAYLIGGYVESLVVLFFAGQSILPLSLPMVFLKKMFYSTLPLTLLLVFNLLYFRIDMVMLSLMQKSSAVGLYDYAYKYFDFLIALPLFLSNSLYPMLLSQEKNYRIQIKNVSLYTLLFFFLGCLLVPIVWIFSPLISLVKQDFSSSILPLRILSLSLPIFFATNILQWIFITKKKQLFLVGVYGISLLINVILNFLYIPQFSYIASSVITDLSELLVLCAMVIYLFLQ